MPIYAVVVRRFKKSRPVTTAVIKEPTGDRDDIQQYLIQESCEKIKVFCKQHPEYKKALWYIDIFNSANDVLENTLVFDEIDTLD